MKYATFSYLHKFSVFPTGLACGAYEEDPGDTQNEHHAEHYHRHNNPGFFGQLVITSVKKNKLDLARLERF